MKPYPAYKESGVEWLGRVPEGWEVKRLRHMVRLQTEKATITDNPIALENIEGWSGRIIATETEFEGTGVAFDAGDILFGKLRPYLAKVAVAEAAGEAVGDFHILRPSGSVLSRFLQLELLTPSVISTIDSSTYGSKMPRVSWDFMADLRLTLPPLPEQQAIAAFLDRETAKIDGLIEEQRRLIALLAEKRQATISHAVTRGLNPAARLKPSGVDWLGDIPEGWEVVRLAYVCDFQQGKAHEPYFVDDGPYICATARFVSTSGKAVRYCSDNLTPACPDDVLMVMSDLPNGRALARAFHVDTEADYAVNQRVCRITVRDGSSRYFYYQLDRHPQLLSENDGANQTHLSNASFTKLPLVIPPVGEQEMIADYLDAQVSTFVQLTGESEAAIALLQERRAALISAAVTGKIDVRDLAPVQDAA